ncbi:MAG: hypothetical protein HeimC2_13620 [Candidatus Heimdallarchaeota archaeon LC_2]|nr:MAG: hypothetical protein HeimC2_13620 [Candidatus Heimdallarchaeota archaeon LC_2]
MTQHTHPLTTHSNLKLKDLILEILIKSNSVLTLDEILRGVIISGIPYKVDKKIIRRLINKLTKKGLVEYVYVNHSYSVRLVDYQFSSNNLEVAT